MGVSAEPKGVGLGTQTRGYGAGLGPRGPSGRRRPMRFIPYKGSGYRAADWLVGS